MTAAALASLVAIVVATAQQVTTPVSQPSAGSALGNAVSALGHAAEAKASKKAADRFDPTFKKYSKRYFGPTFDWRVFKAQGMAESGLSETARSWVGARGVMQLMPSTFAAIQSKRPEFSSIDDPEWNIAAGIMHDRSLWKLYEKEISEEERMRFMFGAYNAGEGTIIRARAAAMKAQLDHGRWSSIETVAPTVQRWRYHETIGYVKKIEFNLVKLGSRK